MLRATSLHMHMRLALMRWPVSAQPCALLFETASPFPECGSNIGAGSSGGGRATCVITHSGDGAAGVIATDLEDLSNTLLLSVVKQQQARFVINCAQYFQVGISACSLCLSLGRQAHAHGVACIRLACTQGGRNLPTYTTSRRPAHPCTTCTATTPPTGLRAPRSRHPVARLRPGLLPGRGAAAVARPLGRRAAGRDLLCQRGAGRRWGDQRHAAGGDGGLWGLLAWGPGAWGAWLGPQRAAACGSSAGSIHCSQHHADAR
jgi:hypothetical protein